jgi:hypothetical protein
MEHPTHEELAEFLYEEVSPARQFQIAQHVDACAECRARVTSWRNIRQALHSWELPQRSLKLIGQPRTTKTWQIVRWAVAAMVMLAVGYGMGRNTGASPSDVKQLRAELAQQLRGELRQDLQTEMMRFATDDLAQQRQEYQRALVQAAAQLEARRLADYTALRRDVETVAVQTQEGFESLASGKPVNWANEPNLQPNPENK